MSRILLLRLNLMHDFRASVTERIFVKIEAEVDLLSGSVVFGSVPLGLMCDSVWRSVAFPSWKFNPAANGRSGQAGGWPLTFCLSQSNPDSHESRTWERYMAWNPLPSAIHHTLFALLLPLSASFPPHPPPMTPNFHFSSHLFLVCLTSEQPPFSSLLLSLLLFPTYSRC